MDIRDLVRALLAGDLLTARQFAADVQRAEVHWESVEKPAGLTDRDLSIAAGLIELLALRNGATPPLWTKAVGPVKDRLVLDPGLEQMPRSFARATTAGPEPLRRRNIVVLPDFLDVA
jgi:hypothetical protein